MENLDKLNDAVAKLKAAYGKNNILSFDEKVDAEIIPLEFYELNQALKMGGIPLGKLIEIFGIESSGKSTLAWMIVSQLSKATGKKILFIDAEMATSREYLKKIGVPVENVIFALPENGTLEDAFEMIKSLLETGAFCGCVVDSIAALVPANEYNSVIEDGLAADGVMQKAKSLTKALRVFGPAFRKSGAVVLLINHTMAEIKAGPAFLSFNSTPKTPGGNAFHHAMDLRLELKPLDFVTQQMPSEKDPKKKVNVKIGRNIRIKVVKSRVSEPFGECTLTLRNGKGFDIITSVIKRGLAEGVIVNSKGGEHFIKDDPAIKASSYLNFWNLFAVNPKLTQNVLARLSGKAVKFDTKELNMSAIESGIKASDLGISEEESETEFAEGENTVEPII